MRICLLNLDFIPYRSSGLAVYGETLALQLAARGHQVTVIAGRRAGLAAWEQVGTIVVYRVAMHGLDWVGYAWEAGPLAAALHGQQPFHVIHFLDLHFAFRFRGPFVASLFQSFRQRATSDGGLPYHSSRRSLVAHLLYYQAARWLVERPTAVRANHLLASSQATADEFVTRYDVQRQRVTVVPLGIDPNRFQRVDATSLRRELRLEDHPVLLYVGFGTPRKGLGYLARALPLLDPAVRLVMIGRWEASYRHKFYRTLGAAADRVVELGYVADDMLHHYYSMADVFVFPSLLEGFGLPLVEAMACGCPVVATAAGSSPEVVGPGGRLVPPRDPNAMAQAINELLHDGALRSRLGQAGHAWAVERFNADRMVHDTLAVYARHCA